MGKSESLKSSMNTSNSFESSNLWGPGTLPAIKLKGMKRKKRRRRERRLELQKGKKQSKSCLDERRQQTGLPNLTRRSWVRVGLEYWTNMNLTLFQKLTWSLKCNHVCKSVFILNITSISQKRYSCITGRWISMSKFKINYSFCRTPVKKLER